jgi:hypothetical protein
VDRSSFENHVIETVRISVKKQHIALKWRRRDVLPPNSILRVSSEVFRMISLEDAHAATKLVNRIMGGDVDMEFEDEDKDRWRRTSSTKLASINFAHFEIEGGENTYWHATTSFGNSWNVDRPITQFAGRVCAECKLLHPNRNETYLILVALLYMVDTIAFSKPTERGKKRQTTSAAQGFAKVLNEAFAQVLKRLIECAPDVERRIAFPGAQDIVPEAGTFVAAQSLWRDWFKGLELG